MRRIAFASSSAALPNMATTSPTLLFSLILLTSTAAKAQEPLRGAILSASTVESVVRQAAARFLADNPQAVGVSIGVTNDGRRNEFTFGRASPNDEHPPSLETLYPIASISKTFTGALLARAQVDHRLRLSDDLRLYLDGSYPNLEYGGRPIRLFDLLDHRSGLPFILPDRPETAPVDSASDRSWNERIAEIAKTYGRSEFLSDLHKVVLRTEPGTSFSYSNAGAQLAGYVLERIYRKPFEAILNGKLLGPLHLRHTAIEVPRGYVSRVAVGYDADGRAMAPVPNWLQGAGAIKSTLGDMLTYATWQLNESNEVVKLSHEPVFTQGEYSAALNWQIVRTGGRRVVWQEGNIEGFNSLCILEPELGLSLVILANEEDPKSAHGYTVMANEILRGLNTNAVLLPTN